MAAPTFVAEYESAWNTNADKTVAVTTAVDDVLVALCAASNWSDSTDDISPPTGGTGLTWTTQETIFVSDYCAVAIFTTVASAVNTGANITLSLSGAADALLGFNILRFSGSDGIGAAEKTNVLSGGPSLNITTTQANSALCVINADWNAVDGASRTWRTVNGITPTSGNGLEKTYFRDAAQYTVYAALYDDAGSVASKTVGLSAPTGQKYAIAVVEVKGTAGGTDATVTPATIAVTASLPAATVSAGSTPTPATVAAAAALPAVALSAGSTVTPAVVAATAALPAATVSAGSTPTPATIAATAGMPAATISAGSTPTPATIATVAALPAVTVSAGGSATATPATVAATVALPAATVSAGSTVTPAAIAASTALPAVTVSAGSTVTPATLPVAAALPAAAPTASSTVTPATIAAVTAVPTASLLAAAAVNPATLTVTVTFPLATVAGTTAKGSSAPTVTQTVASTPAVTAIRTSSSAVTATATSSPGVT